MRLGDHPSIPLWIKICFTAFVAVWVPVYWNYYGPENFLWFCDLAIFIIAVALWIESPLLISSQVVSTLLIQILWIVDVSVRGILGFHPIGGTEYMFDPAHPLGVRLFSLFHVALLPLNLWLLYRIGYDKRGWLLQTAIASLVLSISYLFTAPDRNINWVWGPFGKPQDLVDPVTYLIVLMICYPLVVYFPTHLILNRVFKRKDD